MNFNTPHGNLYQGKPLKPYDGLVSWTIVRVQVQRIFFFMTNQLR